MVATRTAVMVVVGEGDGDRCLAPSLSFGRRQRHGREGMGTHSRGHDASGRVSRWRYSEIEKS